MRNYNNWEEMSEGYELSDGTAIFAVVEFDFDTKEGLVPMRLIYQDEVGYNIQVNDFSYTDQVWLHAAVQKDVARHIKRYYDRAEEVYMFRQENAEQDRLEEC
jgi:hypothetical protein